MRAGATAALHSPSHDISAWSCSAMWTILERKSTVSKQLILMLGFFPLKNEKLGKQLQLIICAVSGLGTCDFVCI